MAVYTHGQHEAVVRSYLWRSVENSAAYLTPHLRPGLSVLDVGCGPGSITAGIAERVAPGRVVAIDVAPEAVRRAQQALAPISNVEVRPGDAGQLDLPDGEFDVVHAHQVLQHVADPIVALREMGRVCRPGGVVAARDSDYAAMTWFPDAAGLRDWLALYRRIARRNGGEPDAGRRLLAWAHAAGFTDIVCSSSTWTYATAAEREWWASVWIDRLTVAALGQQAQRDGDATAEELAGMVDAWRSWASHQDGWFAILHGEILCRRTG